MACDGRYMAYLSWDNVGWHNGMDYDENGWKWDMRRFFLHQTNPKFSVGSIILVVQY